MTIAQADMEVVAQHEGDVISAWSERLRALWGEGSRLRSHLQAVEGGYDAYRYLRACTGDQTGKNPETIIAVTIDRVQSEQFDIADLFREIRCLRESIKCLLPDKRVNSAPGDNTVTSLNQILDEYFETVARETSVIYEHFAERGSQGLVFLDHDGNITYANASARDLLGKPVRDHGKFISSFSQQDRQRFDEILQTIRDDPSRSPESFNFCIGDQDGKRLNIWVEVAHLEKAGKRSVFYLSITQTRVFGLKDEVLERFDHGVVRINARRQICYANRAARKLMDVGADEDLEPLQIDQFFSEGEDREKLEQELRRREAGKLGRYEINLRRPSGRKVPVSIFAIPELNAQGQHVGSIAFMRNLEVERAREDFNRIVLRSLTWKDRLEGLCHWLFDRIEADMISIYRYSDDMSHTSAMATLMNNGSEFLIQRRWYDLSEGLKQWMREPGFKLCGDLKKFLDEPMMDHLKHDETIDRMVNVMGFQSFLATPVIDDGVNKAGLSFLSTTANKFTQDDVDLVERLPLEDLILSAVQLEEREEKAFQFRLMGELSKCRTFKEIALKLTSELAEHYKWDNVSIFDVAEDLGKLVLLNQSQGSDNNCVLPDGFHQASGRGVLGRAMRNQSVEYVPDVTADEDFVREHEFTRSELVIPIFSNLYEPRRVFWLLNIEDGNAEFLLPSEIDELKEIAAQIEFIVNHMIDRVTYQHAVDKTSDGVIITDANGAIRFANPSSCQLLEYDHEEKLIGRKIEELFCDSQIAHNFKTGMLDDSHKVELRRAGESPPVTVLLSRLELPEQISDKYYVFKPLESQINLANLKAVEKLVSITANQVKTPLALVQGILHRLSSGDQVQGQPGLSDIVERSRNLLKKVELSYDRIAYSEPLFERKDSIETYVHIDRLLDSINREVAGDQSDIIEVRISGVPRPISGDRHQIRFVFESLVSYLFRNLAAGEKIQVVLNYGEEHLEIEIWSHVDRHGLEDPNVEDSEWDRVVSDAAFGQSAIRQIVEQHGGEYHEPLIEADDSKLEFRLGLPTSQHGAGH